MSGDLNAAEGCMIGGLIGAAFWAVIVYVAELLG